MAKHAAKTAEGLLTFPALGRLTYNRRAFGQANHPVSESPRQRNNPVKVLLEEHVPRVYRFALRLTGNRHEAEDLTQETFLRAWRHRRRLRDRSAARVWLFAIAANLWRDR